MPLPNAKRVKQQLLGDKNPALNQPHGTLRVYFLLHLFFIISKKPIIHYLTSTSPSKVRVIAEPRARSCVAVGSRWLGSPETTLTSSVCAADDHSRITLKAENSQGGSDYINASPIVSSSSAF